MSQPAFTLFYLSLIFLTQRTASFNQGSQPANRKLKALVTEPQWVKITRFRYNQELAFALIICALIWLFSFRARLKTPALH